VYLRQEIASYVGHGVSAENVILGNGSIELIYMITEAFDGKFNAVIPCRRFVNTKKLCYGGRRVIFVQLPFNFMLETENIKKAITDETKIVYICNPTALRHAL
jgi:histidinol-phosphate/aromatic aminotransferase/cobyric acid decarboxylase-like protein